MALTLAITDAADGTGATATVSGSSAGSVSVYAVAVTGEIGTTTWSSAGSRTGDGTLTLSLAKGFYFAYAKESSTLSPLVYFGVTDGLDAVSVRIRDAVKTTLQLLNLPCTQKVHTIWHESDKIDKAGACTVLSMAGMREAEEPYTNALDGIGRTVRIAILDTGVHQMDASKLPTYEAWRQSFMRAFRNQRVNVTECRWATIEPADVLAKDDRNGMKAVSAFVLRVHTREPRGLGA